MSAAWGLRLVVRLEIVWALRRLHDGEGGGEGAVDGPEETFGGGREVTRDAVADEVVEGTVGRAVV